MKIFGFVVIREKSLAEMLKRYDDKIDDLQIKLGAEKFRSCFLQKKLKENETTIEQLNEMNDALWEMQGEIHEDRTD